MPQHRLNLKVGAPIILIRNLNRAAGLMNGTRLSVTSCLRYTIQATVLTGTQKGNSVCIPRINLTVSDDDDLPIKFIRRQFPVKLAFCITINKSQSQTFSKVGLLLATRPFSHLRIFEAHRSVCSTVASLPILAVQLAERALTAGNYCQNHLLTLSVHVIRSASAGASQHGTCVNQFLQTPWAFLYVSERLRANFLRALHHWCNTLSGALIAPRR